MRRYEDDYFIWLTRKVKNKSHYQLLRFLFETNYYPLLSMDENRANDGIQFRYDYIYEKGIDEDDFEILNAPCTLFEMLLALAFRISLIMADAYKNDDTHIWFWRMLTNLDISRCTDKNFDMDYIRPIIRRFLTRNYGKNGEGCLFVKDNPYELEKIQIWDQAMLYLNKFEERRRPNGTFS